MWVVCGGNLGGYEGGAVDAARIDEPFGEGC